MPVLFTLASAQERPVTQLLWLLPWMTVLVALALLDLQSRVLPNTFTLTLTVTGIAASLIGLTVTIHQALLGLALGYLSFYILQLLYRRLTGRTGVGFGDLKLAAALGVWLGWQPLTLVIMLASLSASFVGLLLILFKCKHRNHYIPFGPFLVLSALIVMLGQPLLILN